MTNEHSEYDFDPYDYPPEFTPEDHQNAQVEGFIDAYDRYRWIMGGKFADIGRESIKHRTRAQGILDLASIGLTSGDLGALSDEAVRLPRDPGFRAETKFMPPKTPYYRHAMVVGLQNRLIDLHATLEKRDLHYGISSDEIPAKDMSIYQWACSERERVAEQLAALGEDIEDMERAIEAGEVEKQDFIEQPHIISDDPEIQRIDDALKEDMKRLGMEVEENEDLKIDLLDEESPVSKTPRLIAAKEEGPAHYDDANYGDQTARGAASASARAQGNVLKEHEVAMMRERLAEIAELLETMGYSRDANMEEVAPQDRYAYGQILAEREHISENLSGLLENIHQVEADIDEARATEPETFDNNAVQEGDDAFYTTDAPDASTSIEDVDAPGDGGFYGDMDGFDMDEW